MKVTTLLLVIVFSIMNISTALAGDRHGHHYNYGHQGHHDNHRYNYGHHDSHYNVYNNYFGHSNNHHNRAHYVTRHYDYGHNGSHAAIAIGGLIVGGAISAILTNSYNNGSSHVGYRQPAYNPYR